MDKSRLRIESDCNRNSDFDGQRGRLYGNVVVSAAATARSRAEQSGAERSRKDLFMVIE
jgi:hypothetical protein